MRTFASILIVTLLAVSCGDGGDASSASTVPTTTATVVVGPTTSTTVPPACSELAMQYVEAARTLFATEGPTDALVEQTRDRLLDLDAGAGAQRCGDAYRVAVCDGLDELTLAGTLVVYQMLTASCI